MSTTTISFTWKVGGVLTDVTSAVLADPTDAFGVQRTDTSATVVAADTALTRDSVGAYSYTLTDPAAGLTYRYFVKVVYNGATYYVEKEKSGSAVDGTAEGYYVKRPKVIATAGTDNFNISFNLDNNAVVADEDIVQSVFDLGDQFVDSIAFLLDLTAESGATSPHFIATTSTVFPYLSYWASRWARAQGYLLRGVTGSDDSAKAEGQMTAMKDEAEKWIRELLGNLKNDGAGDMGFVMVAPSTPTCASDENSGCCW